MVVCGDHYAGSCGNACCYFPIKRINSEEARRLGTYDEHKAGRFTLQNDPVTGACVYLDTKEQRCTVYEKRPQVCRDYSCVRDSSILYIITERREGRRPFEDTFITNGKNNNLKIN